MYDIIDWKQGFVIKISTCVNFDHKTSGEVERKEASKLCDFCHTIFEIKS